MMLTKRALLMRFFSVALAAALVVAPVVAEQADQPSSGAGSSSPAPTARATSPNVPGGTAPQPEGQSAIYLRTDTGFDSVQAMQNPATDGRSFISGKVVLEDGSPPPGPVVIERVCNAISRPEGYTDSRGYFSFQLGQNRSQTDADFGPVYGVPKFWTRSQSAPPSPSGESNLANISGCDRWRASLPGYSSEVVRLDRVDFMKHADSVTIVLSRYTSLLAPTPAKKAFDNGRDAMRKGKWADARKQFEKAVEIFPQYAQAWYELGTTLERLNDVSGARSAYGKAMTEDATFVKPYLQLAGIAAREGKWQELLDTTARVVELDSSNYPGMYFLNAVAQYNLRNFEAAETSAREALRLDTEKRHPAANRLLGVIMAQKGEFTAAADYLRAYLELAPSASDSAQAKKELVEIEKVARSSPEVAR